ncbi:hypothetical protein RI129_004711 [Pyrocoelia pectoralis]|uniref:Uncharacterized protein n=1 Tax=Pyrocoelia pectoralis TaxID=417401 RepID=A0AAN7ZJK3_9COLE
MLKSMVNIREKRDTTKFNELEAFLKRKSKPKKFAGLCPKDVIRFQRRFPMKFICYIRYFFLLTFLFVSIYFPLFVIGCFNYELFWRSRSQEHLNMKIADIEDRDSVMVVNVPESKTGASKKFTFFRQNKCTSRPIGKKHVWENPQQNHNVFRISKPIFLPSSHFCCCSSQCRSSYN